MREQPDHWVQVDSPMDVGPGWKYWVCRYCGAKVENEFGEWYTKHWDDEFGKRSGPVRDMTPRLDWKANHASWCIVPHYLDEQGMGPR